MNDLPTSDSESRPPAAGFVTTDWSVVLAAAEGPSPEAQAALETLCRTYWQPLYAFVRRQGHSPSDAEDLIQSFFERLIGRDGFRNVSREKGRLRSFLLVSLKRFLVNEWHRTRAEKRGGKRVFMPLDTVAAEAQYELEATQELSAETIFDRRWASALLETVFTKLGQECAAADNSERFTAFKQSLGGDAEQAAQAVIAARLGMTENALKQAFHRMRGRYQKLLRLEVANTVAAPGDIEEELRHLVSILRS